MLFFSKYTRFFLTVITVGFFLFFWINGPLLKKPTFFNDESIFSEYAIPKIIGKKEKLKKFGTIKIEKKEQDFGNGLLSNQKKEHKVTGFINSKKVSNTNASVYKDQFQTYLKKLKLPEAKIIIVQGKPLVLFDTDKSIYFETSFFPHQIRGYAGIIDLGIHINKYGEIQNIYHLKSNETKSYLQKLIDKNYFEQYKNISINKETELDAITGATITSEAIAKTVTTVVDNVKNNLISNYVDVDDTEAFSIKAMLNKWWILHVSIIAFFFIYNFQNKFKKTKKSVLVVTILSVIYIGFFLNNSFTYVTFMHPFVGTNISMFVGIYALLTILGSIWGKNLYCKFICPYGNAQKLVLKLSPKKWQSKFLISTKWMKRSRDLLTIVLIVGVLLGLRNWNNYELFPDFFGMEFLSTWFVISLGIILINMKYPLIWCRMLCPTGAILDGIDKISNKKLNW